MIITSLPFAVFFLAAVLLYNIAPERGRPLLLLAASYLFYASFRVPYLLVALVGVTLVSYLCGLAIAGARGAATKQRWLWGGIAVNLSLLVGLKYLPFLAENLDALLRLAGSPFRLPALERLAAIGVSYYVFQGISYLADVYLEVVEAERNLPRFALHVAFFPKLLQGPIERGGKLLPQLQDLSRTTRSNLCTGLHLFVWGLFKKVVIADRLAALADPVFDHVTAHSGASLLVAIYLFAFQLYFDFSGYTDMALGVARCFNLQLTQNFNAPYLATSVADFWRRWHISFSSWILDYIFKPLQFAFRDWERVGTPLALILTFLASGVWHGASWCFVIWGVLHGCYLAFGTMVKQRKQKLYKSWGIAKSRWLKWAQICTTFHLVCFAWIFFRARSVSDAFYIARHALPDAARDLLGSRALTFNGSGRELTGALLLISVAGLVGKLDRTVGKGGEAAISFRFIDEVPLPGRSVIYACMLYLIVICGASTQSFIYLQF